MAFKIYTKTGDRGETSLFGGKRLPKSHLRIDSYGTVDELNAYLGLLRDHVSEDQLREELYQIQHQLFAIGSTLAVDPEKPMEVPTVQLQHVEALEQAIDRMETNLPPLKNFVLPGGHVVVSYCHVARCVCRRAERLLVALQMEEAVGDILLQYLNRLSDYLFVLGRERAQALGAEEVLWKGLS